MKNIISKFYFSPLNVTNRCRAFDFSVFKQCTGGSLHYCRVVMSVFWCFSLRGVGEGVHPFVDVIRSQAIKALRAAVVGIQTFRANAR